MDAIHALRVYFVFFFLKKYLRAQKIIDKQDMEQLAAMVLNGDGQYLIGTKSNQPEIQAFINNVPAYMVRMCLIPFIYLFI